MSKAYETPIPAEVAVVIDSYPQEIQRRILVLRKLIYQTAASLENVGRIEETLKWGEPSFLTPETKSGSTVRIAWKESQPDQYSILFKCTADLVPAFRYRFPETFVYGGNRSIDFHVDDVLPATQLKQCIALALTYHRNKKLDNQSRWDMVNHIV